MNAFHPHAIARRARVAVLIVAAAIMLLTAAFFRIQILSHSQFATQSAENRLRPIRLPAPRGVITDRHGRVLAENVPGYSVALLPGPRDSVRVVLEKLAAIAGLDTAAIATILERYRRAPYLPLVVVRDAAFEVVSALEEQRPLFPGLVIQTEPKRRYPAGGALAHMVGYVGEVTERELSATGRATGIAAGAVVGRDGLERQYDEVLRGRDGYRLVEVSALGRLVRDVDSTFALVPEAGQTLQTTIDLELQQFIAEAFPATYRGAVVALDPRTGEVLALYSSPTFDPNAFVGGISPRDWTRLTTDEARPLINRAIQARYPPASTFKLAVSAMALERGLVGPRTRMPEPCRGGFQYGNRYFRCWLKEGHGTLDLVGAIAQSCDVYFYQLGLKLGLTNMLSDGVSLGFQARSGIDLPFEATPIYPSGTEYFDRRYGPRGWTNAASLNLAIGQGENAQTVVNVVRFFAALARADGQDVIPYLSGSPKPARPLLDLPAEQLAVLRESLVSVVEEGTAAESRLRDLHIAGKTGTAQNPHGKAHGWFVGFAPADQPRIVVGAIVEFGEHGSSVAPLTAAIMAHHLLGAEAARDLPYDRLLVPQDSAPEAVPVQGAPPGPSRR